MKVTTCGHMVSVVVRRMYYWDYYILQIELFIFVSVVVRRMYYWDAAKSFVCSRKRVSVVVRRMYYWDGFYVRTYIHRYYSFSSC